MVAAAFRDIPVYREIAGERRCIFVAADSQGSSAALLDWRERDLRSEVPKPTTAVLLNKLGGKCSRLWTSLQAAIGTAF